MRLTAAAAASARLAASLLALMLAPLLATPSAAADRALLELVGYSPTAEQFAFEAYGIQDGSGFAYADIYIVDLATDSWVAGTPFAARADSEETPLGAIRTAARDAATPALARLGIEVPAQILYLRGDGAAPGEGLTVGWATPTCCGPEQLGAEHTTLILERHAVDSDEAYCRDMHPVGYRLSVQDAAGRRVLHADGDSLPGSRGCTLDYRIHAVVQPFGGAGGHRVAILATYPFGFEGADRRFIAVPIDR